MTQFYTPSLVKECWNCDTQLQNQNMICKPSMMSCTAISVISSLVPVQYCSTRVQGPVPETSWWTTVRAGQTLLPHTDESSTRLHGGMDSTLQVTCNKLMDTKCFGSGLVSDGSGSSILDQWLYGSGSGSRVFMKKNWKKLRLKKSYIFDQIMQFTYPKATKKNVPATWEALSSQKRKIQQSQHFETLNVFAFIYF